MNVLAEGATTHVLSTEQIGSISTALNSAIQNTLTMFIDLLPVMALICGVAFAIRFVRNLFNRTANAA